MASTVRCFVDCTETLCSGKNNGIQRTVRSIISRRALILRVYGVDVIPVVALNGTFYHGYNAEHDKRVYARLLSSFFGAVRNLVDKVFYGKKVNIDAENRISSAHASHTDSASSSRTAATMATGYHEAHLRLIELCRKVLPYLFRVAFYLDNAFDEFLEADINSDDIIFYPDAFWYRSTYLTFTRYPAIRILLLHDIIPITMPDACDAVYSTMFKNSLTGVIKNVEGIIAISRSELATIKSFFTNTEMSKHVLFDYNYWGANFHISEPASDPIRRNIVEVFSGTPTFIMVGTLEPRKNHKFVLDAFERFWHEGGKASLCIIGQVGWNGSSLKERIDKHDLLGSQLFFFQDINDAELAYSYEHCAGVVFASLAEGFGLPLVEAMWYGRPVLASDIAVFHEIGGSYPLFFRPDDIGSLVMQIANCIRAEQGKMPPAQWLTWDQSVENLFGKVIKMSETVIGQRQYR
jgi:glycosyltransferase involved in cell wall biosynthesis